MLIIGVDTGGTFTDLIYRDATGWHVYKLLSTPDNPARAGCWRAWPRSPGTRASGA